MADSVTGYPALLSNLPRIPTMLMRTLYALDYQTTLDQLGGGQSYRTEASRREITGVIMPLSNKDLQFIEEGAYTANSQKLYTNGDRVKVGMYVLDPLTNQSYLVMQELDHGPIHPMKRYMIEAKGASAAP
ncbi:hypothetical protein AGMMS49992_20100 [Clostridia bacterium]|nr:hypothetical protein AGMMS49992_20100 [Clostridia bacterium]